MADAGPTEPVDRPSWLSGARSWVAAVARGSLALALLIISAAAVGVALTSLRFVTTTWLPVMDNALRSLPAEAALSNGILRWPDSATRTLAGNPFLALVVNPAGSLPDDQTAEIQLEFRTNDVRIASLLGAMELPYPRNLNLPLGRSDVLPRWGAWAPHFTGLLGVGLLALTEYARILAALLATLPLRVAAAIGHRQATLGGCWRIALLAGLPASLTFAASTWFYQHRVVILPEFLGLVAAGLLVSIAALVLAPLAFPRRGPGSPFQSSSSPPQSEAVPPADRTEPPTVLQNPFTLPAPDAEPPPSSKPSGNPFQSD